MPVSESESPPQSKSRNKIKRTTILLIILIVVGVVTMLVMHLNSSKKASQSQSSTKASKVSWHEVSIPSHGFKASFPCQNTLATPKQGAEGLMGTISSDTGFIDATCSMHPSQNPTIENPGCQAQVLDGVLPKSATNSAAILQTLSGKKTAPIENVRGATAINFSAKDSTGSRANLYAVAHGRYYNVQVYCTTGYEQIGQQFINSFTPLPQKD